jgi:hypothetical protein
VSDPTLFSPEDNPAQVEEKLVLLEADIQDSKPVRKIVKEVVRQVCHWDWPNPCPSDSPTPDNLRPILEQLEATARENQRDPGATGWADILAEEVGEALRAEDVEELAKELVQLAAVAVSWLLAIDGDAIEETGGICSSCGGTGEIPHSGAPCDCCDSMARR